MSPATSSAPNRRTDASGARMRKGTGSSTTKVNATPQRRKRGGSCWNHHANGVASRRANLLTGKYCTTATAITVLVYMIVCQV